MQTLLIWFCFNRTTETVFTCELLIFRMWAGVGNELLWLASCNHMTADPSTMHGKSRRGLTMQLLCVLLCCLVAACHGANVTMGTIMNSG